MRADIKKLAWSYGDDAEEGQNIPMDYYLEKLLYTLQSC